jgi:biopolymer transport protein TolR
MAMLSGSSRGLQAEPNVTPLIDVLLVLLIIFMVIVPVAPRGLEAMLPQRTKAMRAEPSMPIVVEVMAGPVYRINGQSVLQDVPGHAGSVAGSVAARVALVAELQRIYALRADKTLFVKGDADLSFASVAEAIDAGRAAGVDHIAILTPGTFGEFALRVD